MKSLFLISFCVIWLGINARVCAATLPEGVPGSGGDSGSAPQRDPPEPNRNSEWQSFLTAAARGMPQLRSSLALLWAQQNATYYGQLLAAQFQAAYGTAPPQNVVSNLTATILGTYIQATAGNTSTHPGVISHGATGMNCVFTSAAPLIQCCMTAPCNHTLTGGEMANLPTPVINVGGGQPPAIEGAY